MSDPERICPYNPIILERMQRIQDEQRKLALEERFDDYRRLLTDAEDQPIRDVLDALDKQEAELGITPPPPNVPPAELMAKLSKQQQAIVSALWAAPMLFDDFTCIVWPSAMDPYTYDRAINRLNGRLLELNENFSVVKKGDYISLE